MPLVEQQQLDRRAVRPASRRSELAGVEIERLGPKRLERRPVVELVCRHQVERAEAARIVERHPPPLVGLDDEMVVLADLGRIDAPVARHAEMEDQRVAAIGIDQPVFGPAPKAGDPRAGQPLAEIRREAPAAGRAAALRRARSAGP